MSTDLSFEDVAAVAADLLGACPQAVAPVLLGGNNRIYRLDFADRRCALKFYPRQDSDPRDRLGVEYEALDFLSGHGVDCVPLPLARDRVRNCAVYEWIEGERVADPGKAEVAALGAFLVRLHGLRCASGVERLRPASASYFSAAAVDEQLRWRRRRLEAAVAGAPELARFLRDRFDPMAASVLGALRGGHRGLPADFESPLPPAQLTLSPSDFGFHNALRRNGGIVFLDFEYFGWDDPVKAVCDVMLHPGMELSETLGRYVLDAVWPVFAGADPHFESRFIRLYPAFGLIWCLILLNEFLPDCWARRARPGLSDDRAAAQSRQLEKAERLYQRIVERHGPSSNY